MVNFNKKERNLVTKSYPTLKNFKRIMKFSHSKYHYKLYIDKNDSIWDIHVCEIISWKTVEKEKRKINVPDQVVEKRDMELFNRIKGNPTKIAINKIIGELDYITMIELENKN